MNKRKNLIDSFVQEKKRSLIIIMQRYYTIKDLDECSNCLDIFNALYVSEKKISYEDVAYKFFISINTLKRYIKKFDELAEKIEKVK